MELYSGVREIIVNGDVIDRFYKDKILELERDSRIFDKRHNFTSQNEYVHMISVHTNQSAIGRVIKDKLVLINSKDISVNGVKPRNLRQRMLLDALLDDNIKVLVIFGPSGTGKTLLPLATGLHKIENKTYRRFILSRPMSQLGKRPIGILPGEAADKFGPYLDNYMDNIEHLLDGKYRNTRDLIEQYRMDFKPLQLIQGSSWQGAYVCIDESQVLDSEEMVMIGTRVGEGSKIIISGDLGQRVEKIPIEKTGMHKLVNDKRFQSSTITAVCALDKIERGPVAELFANIFGV